MALVLSKIQVSDPGPSWPSCFIKAEHWEDTSEERHLISSLNSLSTKLSLTSGRAYRYSVKFCASELCFPSLHSDGVTVIHYPPVTGTIAVEYEHTNIGTKVCILVNIYCMSVSSLPAPLL